MNDSDLIDDEEPEPQIATKPSAPWATYSRICLYFVLTITILGFSGRMFWWADMLAQPRLHLAGLMLLMAMIFIFISDWLRLALALVGVALNLLALSAAIPGGNNISNALVMPPGQLRVITLNIAGINPANPVLVNWLKQQSADIIVMIAANRAWVAQLDALKADLPYQKMVDHTAQYGIAILSRFPMDKVESNVAGPLSLPTLTAEVETPVGRLAIMGVHPNPPLSGAYSHARDLYLAQLAAIAQTTSMPTLLVGDFNAAPWSSAFETIRMLPNLQPSSLYVPATWPAMLGPAGLPTQNILLTIPYNKPRAIFFSNLRAGPALPGTDHLPLIADININ